LYDGVGTVDVVGVPASQPGLDWLASHVVFAWIFGVVSQPAGCAGELNSPVALCFSEGPHGFRLSHADIVL
jgi:hypothetical protein